MSLPPARHGSAPRFADPDAEEAEIDGALHLQPGPCFARSPALDAIADRGLEYLEQGWPLHLRGPAGSGKTTLALHIAERLGQPVILLVGDDSFTTARLVGAESGMRVRQVVDRYIHNVKKIESHSAPVWLDRALTTACTSGCTLIYDEFNRAPAAANNVLLSVLEERLLMLPRPGGDGFVRVHPDFRILFTSNPADHVGTHAAQDALLDRMITLDLEMFDTETEIGITVARSGLDPDAASNIVALVRDLRRSGEFTQRPTLRASLMIARLAARAGLNVAATDPRFVQLCLDVLASRLRLGPDGGPDPRHRQMLLKLIEHFCGDPAARSAA